MMDKKQGESSSNVDKVLVGGIDGMDTEGLTIWLAKIQGAFLTRVVAGFVRVHVKKGRRRNSWPKGPSQCKILSG